MVNVGTYFAYRYICDSRKCALLGFFKRVSHCLEKHSFGFVFSVRLSVHLTVRMDQGDSQFNVICRNLILGNFMKICLGT